MAVEFGQVFSRGCVGLRCRYFLDLKAGKWPSCAEMDRPGFRFVFWQDKRSFPVCRGQWCLHSFLIRFWSACFQAAKTFPQWLNLDDWSCMFVSRERLCHCRQWPLCACVCAVLYWSSSVNLSSPLLDGPLWCVSLPRSGNRHLQPPFNMFVLCATLLMYIVCLLWGEQSVKKYKSGGRLWCNKQRWSLSKMCFLLLYRTSMHC